jgi:ankyrin repeat protein
MTFHTAPAVQNGLLERFKKRARVAASSARYHVGSIGRRQESKHAAAIAHGQRLAKLEHKNYKDYFDDNGLKKESFPLHTAAKKGHANEAKLLIKSGINVNDTSGGNGRAPLHFVQDPKTTGVLIKKGAQVNIRDEYERTPLHYRNSDDVETEEHVKTAKRLIDAGADINAQDKNGNTPLHFTAELPNIRELLLKRGAKKDVRNSAGKPALEEMDEKFLFD